MTEPLVSVIIPVYNYANYIQRAINSVLDQTYKNIEVIVVDDGSTDDTIKILKEIKDERVKVFFGNHKGVSWARNFGVNNASGKYVAFLDADDFYAKENIQKKVEILEKNNGKVASSNYILTNGITSKIVNIYSENFFYDILFFKTSLWISSNVVINREFFLEIGGFDEALSTSADWELSCRIAKNTPIFHVPQPCVYYFQHPNQMHKNIKLMEKDMLYALNKLKNIGIIDDNLYEKVLQKLSRILAASFIKDAKNLWDGGKWLIKWITYSVNLK